MTTLTEKIRAAAEGGPDDYMKGLWDDDYVDEKSYDKLRAIILAMLPLVDAINRIDSCLVASAITRREDLFDLIEYSQKISRETLTELEEKMKGIK